MHFFCHRVFELVFEKLLKVFFRSNESYFKVRLPSPLKSSCGPDNCYQLITLQQWNSKDRGKNTLQFSDDETFRGIVMIHLRYRDLEIGRVCV